MFSAVFSLKSVPALLLKKQHAFMKCFSLQMVDIMSNSSASTEETTDWIQVSDKIDSCTIESEKKMANPLMVPAGVDTGMLLERQG